MARQRWVLKKLACDGGHRWETLIGPGKSSLCPTCGLDGHRPDPTEPVFPAVYGDTLWGGPRWVQNLDTQPIYIETKSQYKAELAARGYENRVRHVETPGTGKSEHTISWITGPPPGVDPRPFALLSPAEQVVRRAESATRLGFTVEELAGFSATLESVSLEEVRTPTPAMTFTVER